jgi:hypothetical protein
MMGASGSPIEKYDRVYQHYALLSNLQVQGETVYAGRTNVITLTHGLLLVGLQAFAGGNDLTSRWVDAAISIVGVILSAAWLAFEQRNQIYFNGRGEFLARAEAEVLSASAALGIPVHGMWTTVGPWVATHAKWYQRYSAPRIQRGLVPVLFICMWLFIGTLQVAKLATYHSSPPKSVVCHTKRNHAHAGVVSCRVSGLR